MRILAVNWLDCENPQAGGAEVHFFEIFRRLVERGHEVVLVASGWAGAKPRATIDGIDVHRFGGRHTFALRARAAVRRMLEADRYDVVVEDINKLPLLIPTLTRLPFCAVVPHLFGTTAFREASIPVAGMVWLAERFIPFVYRRAAFHAISRSTREDLIERGVRAEAVKVILPGVDSDWFTPDAQANRTEVPTFLFVGRLKRYKGIAPLLHAVALLRKRGHDICLDIVGRGDDLGRLEGIVRKLQLEEAVRFLGFVTEEKKRRLLRRVWAVVFPSAKEGWGIVNIEAAACGTPAIASDSPGLRESVLHDKTGILVPHGDISALADALLRLASDRELVDVLGRNAREYAESLTWRRTADLTEAHLLETSYHAGGRQKERDL